MKPLEPPKKITELQTVFLNQCSYSSMNFNQKTKSRRIASQTDQKTSTIKQRRPTKQSALRFDPDNC